MVQARDREVGVRFGGTVGAPLPVLEITERVLIGARISSVAGILNGTTNQILTAMARGASYDEGVRQAQEIGIAETDPTLDVDGWDAAAKAVIVANAVLGGKLHLSDVGRTGIRDITAGDLEEAGRQGETIKLVARVRVDERGVSAEVKPERHSVNSFLGRLDGANMGVSFRTEPLGDLNLSIEESGSGVSGGISTALTVLRDVVNLTRQPVSAGRPDSRASHPRCSIRAVLLLPDRHDLFEPVDRVLARRECFGSVRARYGDSDCVLTDFEPSQAVLNSHGMDRPAF
jgi:homoserine dehydrogenase